jgi:glucan biosynthesis protein C
LPIALIQITLRGLFPGYQNWADFLIWLFLFVYGFIFFADPRFQSAFVKQWKFNFIVGVVSFLVMLAAHVNSAANIWVNTSGYSPAYVLYQLLVSIVMWSWMTFVLYFGVRFLNSGNKVIDYCDEAILPFYVLHYPVIVVLAFLSFRWDIHLGVQFLIVSSTALIATLIVYDLFIRRIKFARWLFGMKPLHA